MVNISAVYGDYTFDFKDTNTNAQEQVAWLVELSKLSANNVDCKTNFCNIECKPNFHDCETFVILDLPTSKDDMAILRFTSSGYPTYDNNIKCFESNKDLKAHLLKMSGLKIKISYEECEEGKMLTTRRCYVLDVLLFDEGITITQAYEACDANPIGWEFGLEKDLNKQFADKEIEKKKTGLYQVTLNYAYRDPESEWWVEPSDTYCAFTSAEKAKEFAIEKIKREWSHLTQISELEFVEQNPKKDSDELESVSIVVKEILILDK